MTAGPFGGDPPAWLQEIRDKIADAMIAADGNVTAATARAEGIAAQVRVRVSQISCARCYGDDRLAAPQLACTCPEWCRRRICQAPGLLDDLDSL
jgi:hypothetical protein